jgi:hypothetical protein
MAAVVGNDYLAVEHCLLCINGSRERLQLGVLLRDASTTARYDPYFAVSQIS